MRPEAAPREGGKLISGAGVSRQPAAQLSQGQFPAAAGARHWLGGDVPPGEGHVVVFCGKFPAFSSPSPPRPHLVCDRFVKVKWYFLIKQSILVISAHFPLVPYLLSDLRVTLNLSGPESLCVIERQYFLTLPEGQDDKLIHIYVVPR